MQVRFSDRETQREGKKQRRGPKAARKPRLSRFTSRHHHPSSDRPDTYQTTATTHHSSTTNLPLPNLPKTDPQSSTPLTIRQRVSTPPSQSPIKNPRSLAPLPSPCGEISADGKEKLNNERTKTQEDLNKSDVTRRWACCRDRVTESAGMLLFLWRPIRVLRLLAPCSKVDRR